MRKPAAPPVSAVWSQQSMGLPCGADQAEVKCVLSTRCTLAASSVLGVTVTHLLSRPAGITENLSFAQSEHLPVVAWTPGPT